MHLRTESTFQWTLKILNFLVQTFKVKTLDKYICENHAPIYDQSNSEFKIHNQKL